MENASNPVGNPQAPVNQPAKVPGKGLAITSLVLGIVGVVAGFCPFTFFWLGYILAILAIIFGAVGRKHGLGKAGLILGIVAFAASLFMTVRAVMVVSETADEVAEFAASMEQFEREMNAYESSTSSRNW